MYYTVVKGYVMVLFHEVSLKGQEGKHGGSVQFTDTWYLTVGSNYQYTSTWKLDPPAADWNVKMKCIHVTSSNFNELFMTLYKNRQEQNSEANYNKNIFGRSLML